MCHEWVEVPVAVEQSEVLFDAACRDQAVDWFAHRDTEVAQTTVIARSRDCAVGAAEFDDLEHDLLLALLDWILQINDPIDSEMVVWSAPSIMS